MHEGYKKYLDILKSKKMINPKSEKEWKKAVGIVEKEEYEPFLAKRSASHRNTKPTLDNHIVIDGKKIAL
jgi:hypothetical protein